MGAPLSPGRPPSSGSESSARTMEQLADDLGASDIFVFRRVTSSRFVHVGGAGRGRTWTAPLEVDLDTDPFGARLRVGQPLWMHYREPQRIFGPYHAASAVAVRLNQDVLVVCGATTAQASGFGPTTATLIEAAERAIEWSENLTPARHLAEELEIVHARKALAARRGPDGTVADALADVAEVAATALSCEVAVTWLPDGRYHVHESGWALPDRDAAVRTVLQDLWNARAALPHCVQDAKQAPLAFPLDHASGVRSYYVLPFGAPASALLLVAHTEVAPRGFTSLCQALATELMLTANTVLARAVLREQLLHALAEESAAREELARANTELAKVALHDPLTGLPNRVLLERHTEGLGRGPVRASRSELPRAERNPALLYIDLDNFKSINDDFGHTIGDGVLVEFSRRLRESCRPSDVPARLAGDEFAILMVEPLTAEQALTVADRVVRAAVVPFLIADKVITIGASVGIATADNSGQPAPPLEVLLHRADLAMYRAKTRGRGRCEVYTERTAAPIITQSRRWADDPAMGRRLRTALDDGQLVLRYQPRVDLLTGEVLATEALVYWPRPASSAMGPAQLVPLAERTGLIGPLGEWAIRAACRQAALWHRQAATGAAGAAMAVNVSPSQLTDPDFVNLVADILRETGLQPGQLSMEVGEPSMSTDSDELVAVLNALRDVGVRLAVDGFGAGTSSLAGLRHLPLDWLKIDEALVRTVDVEPTDAVLMRLVIESAHCLGLRVFAQGVDRHAQLEQLATMGCDAVQSSLLGGPVEAHLLDTRIRSVRRLVAPDTGGHMPTGAGHLTAVVDASGVFTYVSAESVALLGYQPNELVGTQALNMVAHRPRHRAKERFSETPTERTLVHALLHKDGRTVWVEATHRVTRDPQSGAPLRLATVAMDITERVQAEEERTAREHRLQTVFESAPHSVVVLTADGVILQVNASLLRLLGWGEHDMVGRKLHEFVHAEDIAAPTPLVPTDGEATNSRRLLRADGRAVPAELTLRVIRNDSTPPYLVGHIRSLVPHED